MADRKITDHTAITSPDDADVFEQVDVSDSTDAASGTNKKITWANIKATIKTYYDAVTSTFTNKTIDANGTGNSITNLEVADLATGVLDTDLSSVSASDDTIPSAKATKTALDAKQALDSDLTTIAGLTATSDNFIQSKTSAWASRTPTQVTADLIVMVGDTGSGGSKGLVPAPTTGDATKFLKGDATWTTIPGGGDALTSSSLAQFAVTTSLELKGVISDETGSGLLVFATSPVLTTPNLGTPSAATLTNATGLPIAGLVASTSTAIGVGSVELGHATDATLTRVSAGVAAIEGVTISTSSNTLTLTNKTLTSPAINTATLGGHQVMLESAAFLADPVLSADGVYNGWVRAGTAGATLAFGDLCYLDPTDSRWELADGNAAAAADGDARGVLGICVLAAAADGDPTIMLRWGWVRADTAFPAFTINNPVYVSETAGDVTGTQPTTTDAVIRIVGIGETGDELFFNPDNTWTTHT